ncbi:FAD-dependent monooxygenase [Massilia sp. W12]|uniref:FAD-dependent monooxygenase n=1 Tax=Massilia sp. W12 TaxID=3126507 RepID=UPI0030D00471
MVECRTPLPLAICGAGPCGLALALLLRARGMAAQQICLFDAGSADKALSDPRTLALSWGSRQILQNIHAFPQQAAAIEEIHVSRRGYFGRTMITSGEYGLPALGYVLRYGDLMQSLLTRAAEAGLEIRRGWQLQDAQEQPSGCSLQFATPQGAQTFDCEILAQAEGGLFGQQAARAFVRDYAQTAIICEVRVSQAQAGRAYERFTDQGPLALLPIPPGAQGMQYALVWCVQAEQAAHLQSLEAPAFLQELQTAFGARMGQFLDCSTRHAFKLGVNAGAPQGQRMIAIGNAAQTLHPVAGQGLNLGLRDATVLARLLARENAPQQLAQFARERANDRRLIVRLTDSLARIFTSQGGLPQGALALSLGALDLFAPARATLASWMMYGMRR